jgi:hypothetical protein
MAAWLAILVLAGPVPLAAQGTSPPAQPVQDALTFRAAMDPAISTNLELAAVRLRPHPFHGEWNYSIRPHTT